MLTYTDYYKLVAEALESKKKDIDDAIKFTQQLYQNQLDQENSKEQTQEIKNKKEK